LNAVAVLPVLLRTSASTALAVVPVSLTPCELMQLLKAARVEALIAWPPPRPKPAGAYFWHALNAAESALAKDPRGRDDPLGNARRVKDPVGRAPGEKDPPGRPPNCPGVIFTPCCFRHDWNALSLAVDVALAELLLAADALPLLPPPHPASKSAPATAGNAARRTIWRRVNRRLLNPPSMMISSRCGG
jgi:hypothetical protein